MSDREDLEAATQGAARPDPYALIHTASVVVQREDGTLDLHFEEGPFAGGNDPLSVPFEPGLNCKMAFAGGELVRVAFAGGRPDGMFAFGRTWNGEADKGVVRVGDGGSAGRLVFATSTGLGPTAFTVTYLPPRGPPVGPLTISLGADGSQQIDLETEATEGSEELKIP